MSTRWMIAALAVLSADIALAQTTKEEAELQAQIEKLKAEAATSKAEAKKAELELQQAEEAARLDLQAKQDAADETRRKALGEATKAVQELKTDAKDVTVSGTAIESKALTYRTLPPIGKRIVEEIRSHICADAQRTVLIADDAIVAALPAYEVGALTLETLSAGYKSTVDQAREISRKLREDYDGRTRSGIVSLTLLLQGIAAVGSVAQTFKTQLSVASTDLTIDGLAVQAVLAGHWATASDCAAPKKVAFLTAYPNASQSYKDSAMGVQFKTLNQAFNEGLELETDLTIWLSRARQAAEAEAKRAAAAAGKQSAAAKKAAQEAEAKAKEAGETLDAIDRVLSKLKEANQRLSGAIQGLVTTSEKQPVSPLVQLVKLERFAALMKQPGTYVLMLKPLAGGGNTVTTNSFWRGPHVFHSGGSAVTYTLMRSDGAYVAGGVLDSHSGYRELQASDTSSIGHSWKEEQKQK